MKTRQVLLLHFLLVCLSYSLYAFVDMISLVASDEHEGRGQSGDRKSVGAYMII